MPAPEGPHLPKKNGKLGLSDAAWAFATSEPKTCDTCRNRFRSTDTREPFRCWRCTAAAHGQTELQLEGGRDTHATRTREQALERPAVQPPER